MGHWLWSPKKPLVKPLVELVLLCSVDFAQFVMGMVEGAKTV